MRIFLLDYGYTNVDKGLVLTLGKDMGKIVSTPIWGALLETDSGYVLVDTGMNPIHILHPDATFAGTSLEGKIVPVMTPAQTAEACVRSCGVKPEEIRYVINSHFHFDHCGGNLFFPQAESVVQKKHYEWAMDSSSNCPRRDFDIADAKWHFVDGEMEFLPGIHLILTPGHVPYHQSILIESNHGNVIIAADAASLKETTAPCAEITADDPAAYHASIAKLCHLCEQYHAKLLLSHDQAMWDTWPHAPLEFC